MGRRKRKDNLEFPSLPVPLVDAMLYAEEEMRKAVKEEREAFSFIGGRDPIRYGGAGKKSDNTARAALKLAGEIPSIVLDDGRTVKRPETWLKVFDDVREKAKECNRPDWILETWDFAWEKEWRPRFVKSDLIDCWKEIKAWIRQEVLIGARAAGLVSFSDEAIMDGVKEAYLDPWDGTPEDKRPY